MENNNKKYLIEEYVSRINKVIDYIESNLTENLSLEKLSKVASFSQFHFHRIFRAMVGETLNDFIQRVRIEKAAAFIIANPKKSITEIALDCGFSSSSVFARAFKEQFKMNATQWREKNSKICKEKSKIGKQLSNTGKDHFVSSYYIDSNSNNLIWRIKMNEKKQSQIEVKKMPELTLAYVRGTGPFKGDPSFFAGLFEKLIKWAGPRELLNFPETKSLCVYHDDPKVTDENKLRVSVCITVPKDTAVDGEVGKMTIPGGKFAVARFELADNEYEEAWDTVMGKWMPESGFQPDDNLCYELYQNTPEEHPEKKCIVDICVPVKPL